MREKTIYFKVNAEMLYQLLTGEVVEAETQNGTAKFFMEDIGINQVNDISQKAVKDVYKKMTS